MDFKITNFQFDAKHQFRLSYKVDSFIEHQISKAFSQVEVGFNLVFSISCYSDNPDQLILKDQMRGRKNPKVITQLLSFPYSNLENRDDWILNVKSFDFEKKKNAYKTYPLDKYVCLIVDSLSQFFQNEGINISVDLDKIKEELIEYFNCHSAAYAYLNGELLHLSKLIDGSHWSFRNLDVKEDEDGITGREWLESENGQKWLALSRKYRIDSNGSLIKK